MRKVLDQNYTAIYLFIIKSYTEYNKHIKEKSIKNEHREKIPKRI